MNSFIEKHYSGDTPSIDEEIRDYLRLDLNSDGIDAIEIRLVSETINTNGVPLCDGGFCLLSVGLGFVSESHTNLLTFSSGLRPLQAGEYVDGHVSESSWKGDRQRIHSGGYGIATGFLGWVGLWDGLSEVFLGYRINTNGGYIYGYFRMILSSYAQGMFHERLLYVTIRDWSYEDIAGKAISVVNRSHVEEIANSTVELNNSTDNNLYFRFDTVGGIYYSVYRSSDLEKWDPIESFRGDYGTKTIRTVSGSSSLFFRVRMNYNYSWQ